MLQIMFLMLCVNVIGACDEGFFFRATPLFELPRIARKGLLTSQMRVSYGSTEHARSGCEDTRSVPVWDCWGIHDMQQIGVGVPNKDLSNQLDFLLEQMQFERSRISGNNCDYHQWAAYTIKGRVRLVEGIFDAGYNITKHFFVSCVLPFRLFMIEDPDFIDLSQDDSIAPNKNTPLWKAFKSSFDAILNRYDLERGSERSYGLGDFALYGGYTYNYQESDNLDFVDFSFQLGVVAPTSKKKDQDKLFSLATGNDGHTGISFLADIAFGFYDWLTIAAHLHAVGFFDRTTHVRIKTGAHQSGVIYLAKEKASIHRGNQINAGVCLQADHIVSGFSATVGYSFAQKNKDTVTPCDQTFSATIASSEGSRLGWKMHSIHASAEYDFSHSSWRLAPKIGVFYDAQVAGRRIFKMNMVGGNIGLDFLICY